MAAWFHLNINADRIATVEIRRRERLDITDQAAIQDTVSTYDVFLDDQPVGTVEHRYGDRAFRLVSLATDLIDYRIREAA